MLIRGGGRRSKWAGHLLGADLKTVKNGAKAEKIRRKIEKLREAKARTLRRVLLARSCTRVG